MGKKFAVDRSKVFKVRAKKDVACRVSVAHRSDYDALLRKGAVLAVDDGNGAFHLVEQVGSINALRKDCVEVVGPAPPRTTVYFNKKRFVSRRV